MLIGHSRWNVMSKLIERAYELHGKSTETLKKNYGWNLKFTPGFNFQFGIVKF